MLTMSTVTTVSTFWLRSNPIIRPRPLRRSQLMGSNWPCLNRPLQPIWFTVLVWLLRGSHHWTTGARWVDTHLMLHIIHWTLFQQTKGSESWHIIRLFSSHAMVAVLRLIIFFIFILRLLSFWRKSLRCLGQPNSTHLWTPSLLTAV